MPIAKKKIIVIDDEIGYTGGMNISGEYCGYDVDGGINKFRDTHTRLQGDIVRYLKESLYFSVLDINPSLPPTFDEEDDDDTDIDIDTDDEIDGDDDGKKEESAESRQRLFPYQMLPGFLTKFNSYRKYKKFKENEGDIGSVDDELNENEEKLLFGRKKRWNEAWKRNKRNLYDETYKNRLKILASSPRKSLSEWIKYYEQNDDEIKEEKLNKIQTKSALEVSALSHLMDDANKTKNFSYSFGQNQSNDDSTESQKEAEHNLYIQVLESYRDKRFRLIQRALISAIDNAESHIFIMNPYFLPPRKLKKRLRNASARGVDIRVITCDQSDVPFISMASRHIYEELLSHNIRLFEYEGNDSNECANILHGKVCLIDDVFVSLGSFNWDDWSYTKNLEMNLMIIDNKVAKSMHEQFVIDQERSKEIKLENVQNDRSVFQKCLYYGAWVASRIANRIT